MKWETLDVVLLGLVVFFVGADIILALSLVKVLPNYITKFGWYPAYGDATFEEASYLCPCLHGPFPNGTDELIDMRKIPQKTTIEPDTDMEPPNVNTILKKNPVLLSYNHKVFKGNRYWGPHLVCAALIFNATGAVVDSSCASQWDNKKGGLIGSNSAFAPELNREIAVEHEIKDTSAINVHGTDMFYMEVDPPFKFKKELVYDETVDWEFAYVVGWEEENDNNSFTVEHWTTRDRPRNIFKMCRSYTKPLTHLKFAFTYCNELLNFNGFDEEEFCETYHAYKYKEERDGPIPLTAGQCKVTQQLW